MAHEWQFSKFHKNDSIEFQPHPFICTVGYQPQGCKTVQNYFSRHLHYHLELAVRSRIFPLECGVTGLVDDLLELAFLPLANPEGPDVAVPKWKIVFLSKNTETIASIN